MRPYHSLLLLLFVSLICVESQETCSYCNRFVVSFNNTRNYYGIPHPAIRDYGTLFGFDALQAYFVTSCDFPSCNQTDTPTVLNNQIDGGSLGPDRTWGWKYDSNSVRVYAIDGSNVCQTTTLTLKNGKIKISSFKSLRNGKWGILSHISSGYGASFFGLGCHMGSKAIELAFSPQTPPSSVQFDGDSDGDYYSWVVYDGSSNKLTIFACHSNNPCSNGTINYNVGKNGGLNPNGISVSIIRGNPNLLFSFASVYTTSLHCSDELCTSFKIDSFGDLSLMSRAVRGMAGGFLVASLSQFNELWTFRCIDDNFPCQKQAKRFALPSLPPNPPSSQGGGTYSWALDLVSNQKTELISISWNLTYNWGGDRGDLQTGNMAYSFTPCASAVASVSPASVDLLEETRMVKVEGAGFCTGISNCLVGGIPVQSQMMSQNELACTIPVSMLSGNYPVTVNGSFGSAQLQVNNLCPNDCSSSKHQGECSLGLRRCVCVGNWLPPDCSKERIDCPKNCSGLGICDFATGICNCTFGRNGTDCTSYNCQTCDTHFCDVTTGECKDPSCDPQCQRGVCVKGKCRCDDGWTGSDCSSGIDKRALIAAIIIAIYAAILGLLTSLFYFKTLSFEKPPKRTEPLTKRNLSNIITIGSIPLEYIQLSVFGLSLKSEWSREAYQDSSFTVFNFDKWTSEIFWAVFAVTLFWSFLMLPLLIKIQGKVLLRRVIQTRIFRSFYSLFVVFLVPFGTFLVLPCIRTLLKMVQCNYNTASVYVVGMKTVTCWKGEHWKYVFPALFAFGIYFPLATYSLPRLQTSKKSVEILLNVRFLFFQKQLYAALVVSQVMFVQFESLRIFSAMIVAIGLLVCSLDSCYNIPWLNKLQTGTYTAAIWTCAMSAWATFIPPENRSPLWSLIAGNFVILLITLMTMSNRWRNIHKGTTSDLLSAFEGGEPNERSKLMQRKEDLEGDPLN
eukprot:TRINITY_DN4614_c1_g1_i1.p1 TRINITY_DN4614_c1_g1~~TRINITY_DN4614_c1_g1_i1.p1  ORF type:complete len:957 (+),score=203.10 TRINITY_DN4614_c1_g1_i1:14-2884(+)